MSAPKAAADPAAVAEKLLDLYGRTFSDEHGMGVEKDTPSPLFQMLIFSLLSSTRIGHDLAADAFTSLKKEGWLTAEKMAESKWLDRVAALHRGRYGEYQEQGASYLGETAALCISEYGGDLRKLREKAGRDPAAERELLKAFKGIGDVGADLFCREVQVAWDEHLGFCDRKAKSAAKKLGLDAEALRELVAEKDLPRLIAALVRCDLDDGYAVLKE